MAKPATLHRAGSPVIKRSASTTTVHARETPAANEATDPAGRAYVSILGLTGIQTSQIVSAVKKGLPYRAFERFVATTTISSSEAATLVGIPIRTLTRRKQQGRLTAEESDRLLRATRVLGRAIDLFEGSTREAKHWLTRVQPALGGATPIEMASTEVGALAVERLLGQLEHGVFV